MPSQLIKNDNVSFVCSREFTYAGEQYHLGDDFPQEKALNIETLVRTRYLIPVIDSIDDKPRHWHREVRLRANVMEKLGVKEKVINLEFPSVPTDDVVRDEGNELRASAQKNIDAETKIEPEDHTVDEVLQHADEHPDQIGALLDAEEDGKDRVTLTSALESRKLYDPAEHTVIEVLDYLTGEITEDERNRVLEAESDEKARKGILDV